jgi:protein-S-isoprenylcysteine O-methyltransferase Ste14
VTTELRPAPAEAVTGRRTRLLRLGANLVGAAGAAYFARRSLDYYRETHRLIGAGFLLQQTWVVVAYLVRRPARAVSRRPGDWLLAFGGTFGGVLLVPTGAHPQWGLDWGLYLQIIGVAMSLVSYFALGRSFGFAAADRGLVRRGPYAVVRHPVYTSYLLVVCGYLLQSICVWNALVVLLVTGCNVGRAVAEERLLAATEPYAAYRSRVRWRLVPGVW